MSRCKFYITLLLTLCIQWKGDGIVAQNINQTFKLPQAGDTSYLMQDNQPHNIRFWPFQSDSSKWDLNGVRAPYIKRTILQPTANLPEALKGSNAFIWTGHQSREFFKVSPQSIESIGITGIELFGDDKRFTGYYFPPKPVRKAKLQIGMNPKEKYKLIYNCDLLQLPPALQSQLPYVPDSVRIITAIETSAEFKDSTILDLQLHRYNTIREDRISIHHTWIETRKANLDWQNVTRFVRFTEVFRTDTIKEIFFYSPNYTEPIASIKYLNNRQLDYIRYQAPDIYKDLIVIDDFKPNLFFFPNPYTFGTLRIELLINKPGLYTLRIVNLIGAEVWRENFYLESNRTLDYSFSFLNKGTYFLIFQQDMNQVISSKRLLILKP